MCILTITHPICPLCHLALTPQPSASLVHCPPSSQGESACTQRSYFEEDDRGNSTTWDNAYDIVHLTDESVVCAGCYGRAVWMGRVVRFARRVKRGLRRGFGGL